MGIRLHRPRISDSTNTSSSGSAASTASSMNGDIVRMSKSVLRGRKRRYTVPDLPFPRGGGHKQTWRRSFVPSLLAWAGAQEDPFGVNGDLYDAVDELWSRIYPQITLEDDAIMVVVKVVR